MAPSGDLAWWIRLRGAGRIFLRTHGGAEAIQEQSVAGANPQWDWHVLSISAPSVFGQAWLEVSVAEGEVQMDLILLAAGQWPREWPGNGLRIPAEHFFHAGYAEADGSGVVLRRAHDPDIELFYGPRMPLPGGAYSVEIEFTADAPEGAEVARFGIRQPAAGVQEWAPLRAGAPARLVASPESNLPVVIALKYNRTHDLKIHAVTITPLANPESGEAGP
ncbi:MAG TPA: hypothetical protein DCM68_02745 [Verrucomicrobia bacterium]|nr:hypothetical protein [Verrucomicrobiota bacterium]